MTCRDTTSTRLTAPTEAAASALALVGPSGIASPEIKTTTTTPIQRTRRQPRARADEAAARTRCELCTPTRPASRGATPGLMERRPLTPTTPRREGGESRWPTRGWLVAQSERAADAAAAAALFAEHAGEGDETEHARDAGHARPPMMRGRAAAVRPPPPPPRPRRQQRRRRRMPPKRTRSSSRLASASAADGGAEHPSIRTSNIGGRGQRGGPWRRAALNAGFHARGHPTRSEGRRPPVVVSSTSTCGAYDATAVARVDRGVLLGRSARARETRGRVPRRADGAGEVGSEMMAGMNVGGVRAYSTRVSRDARRTSHVLCCISERHPMCPIRGR